MILGSRWYSRTVLRVFAVAAIPGLLVAAEEQPGGGAGFQTNGSGDCYDACMSAFGWAFNHNNLSYRYNYCTGPTDNVITCYYNRV